MQLNRQLVRHKPGIVPLQLGIWLSVLLLIFFSLFPMDGFPKSIIYTLVNTVFYAIIIYGNILFLYPTFYQKGQTGLYILLAILFIVFTGITRGFITLTLYNQFVLLTPHDTGLLTLMGYIPGGILTFVLSLIFRIAIAYFTLKQQTEEILIQKSQTELALLKSQVQPHFLFNTLNNIYYEAYREAPRTAGLIERLSEIMRYFVDESPKDTVAITTEVEFIDNYIALEKIRIRHEVLINFEKKFSPNLRIPPMLLMTFVENIVKHGIDKSSTQNQIDISLEQQDGYLLFTTSNKAFDTTPVRPSTGFGIANLTKRLTMLYGSNFDLRTDKQNGLFTAFLKIPLA
jgi:sensor histidine kinase YesM